MALTPIPVKNPLELHWEWEGEREIPRDQTCGFPDCPTLHRLDLGRNYREENNQELNEAWPDGPGFLRIPTAQYPILRQEKKTSRKSRMSFL